MSESAAILINQILLKPIALVLPDQTTTLSEEYVAALTADLAHQIEEASITMPDEPVLEALTLEYVRPMSGGVHVLRVSPPVDLARISQMTTLLSERDDIEYAEPDQPRRR